MIYEGTLQPRGAWEALELSWDSETGEFNGPGGLRAGAYVELIANQGYIELAPAVHHPLTGEPLTAEEVGSILDQYWHAGEIFPLLRPDMSLPDGVIS